jgi:hypothetical protein
MTGVNSSGSVSSALVMSGSISGRIHPHVEVRRQWHDKLS